MNISPSTAATGRATVGNSGTSSQILPLKFNNYVLIVPVSSVLECHDETATT